MDKLKYYLENLFYIIGIILMILLVLAFIGLQVYAIVKYGNTPINEVPTWIAWLLWRR